MTKVEALGIDLLTEPEVAEMLRCSTSTVKRLRLGGKLAYLPGRPVMIERQAIFDYLDAKRVPVKHKGPTIEKPAGPAQMEQQAAQAARAWALQAVMSPPRARRGR